MFDATRTTLINPVLITNIHPFFSIWMEMVDVTCHMGKYINRGCLVAFWAHYATHLNAQMSNFLLN